MSQPRSLGIAIALSLTFGLVACGDDDEGAEGGTASADLARYCELSQELVRAHGVAAELHDHDGVAEPLDVRQRLQQDVHRAIVGGGDAGARHGARPTSGSPSVSGRPAMRFRHWMAWPAVPFTRLSMAQIEMTVPVRSS